LGFVVLDQLGGPFFLRHGSLPAAATPIPPGKYFIFFERNRLSKIGIQPILLLDGRSFKNQFPCSARDSQQSLNRN
jgi:hypothetical protein